MPSSVLLCGMAITTSITLTTFLYTASLACCLCFSKQKISTLRSIGKNRDSRSGDMSLRQRTRGFRSSRKGTRDVSPELTLSGSDVSKTLKASSMGLMNGEYENIFLRRQTQPSQSWRLRVCDESSSYPPEMDEDY